MKVSYGLVILNSETPCGFFRVCSTSVLAILMIEVLVHLASFLGLHVFKFIFRYNLFFNCKVRCIVILSK